MDSLHLANCELIKIWLKLRLKKRKNCFKALRKIISKPQHCEVLWFHWLIKWDDKGCIGGVTADWPITSGVISDKFYMWAVKERTHWRWLKALRCWFSVLFYKFWRQCHSEFNNKVSLFIVNTVNHDILIQASVLGVICEIVPWPRRAKQKKTNLSAQRSWFASDHAARENSKLSPRITQSYSSNNFQSSATLMSVCTNFHVKLGLCFRDNS